MSNLGEGTVGQNHAALRTHEQDIRTKPFTRIRTYNPNVLLKHDMTCYLVMVMRTAQFQASAIAPHQAFLETLRQNGQLELAGPFTDKSGGAYVIRAENLAAAQALAFTDPLHTTQSSLVTVYEWSAS